MRADLVFTEEELRSINATRIETGSKLGESYINGKIKIPGKFEWLRPETIVDINNGIYQEFHARYVPEDPWYNPVENLIVIVKILAEPPHVGSFSITETTGIIYGQMLQESIITGNSPIPGKFQWAYPTTVPHVADSLVTDFPVIFIPDDEDIATVRGLTAKLRITPASIDIGISEAVASSLPFPYGTRLKDVEFIHKLSIPGTFKPVKENYIPNVWDKEVLVDFIPSTEDYYPLYNAKATIEVLPVAFDVSLFEDIKTTPITMGEPLSMSTITANGPVTGTYTWLNPTIIPKYKDSKKTLYDVEFTPLESENYKTTIIKASVEVLKPMPPVTEEMLDNLKIKEITYGMDLSYATITGEKPCAGEWQWVKPSIRPEVADSNKTEYELIFKSKDDRYRDWTSIKKKVTVNKLQLTSSSFSTIYCSAITYGQKLSDSNIRGTCVVPGAFAWDSPATVPTNAEYEKFGVTFTPVDTANIEPYKFTARPYVYRADLKMLKDDLEGEAIDYGQTLDESKIKGSTPVSTVTKAQVSGAWYWIDSTIAPTVPESKKNRYGIVFVPDDLDNYVPYVTVCSVTVNKIAPIFETKDVELTYSEEPLALNVYTNSPGKLSARINTEGIVYLENDRFKCMDVGEASVTLKLAESANYLGAESDVKIRVSPKPLMISGTKVYRIKIGTKTLKLDA